MFEGILVDLVPYGDKFLNREHTWFNGESIFFWSMGGRWILSKTEMKSWQQERLEDEAAHLRRAIFGVQTKDGTPIGMFGANWILYHNGLASLTAHIGEPDYWGGGYGTDALLLVVDYLFDWLDMRKVWLTTMSLNTRVMRQMEKVGFRLEVRQREATWAGHAWQDALMYGMLREEWPGRAALVEQLGIAPRQLLKE